MDSMAPWTDPNLNDDQKREAQYEAGWQSGYSDGVNGRGCPDEPPHPTPYSSGYDAGHPIGRADREHKLVDIKVTLSSLALDGRGSLLKILMDSWQAEDAKMRKERHESLVEAMRNDPSIMAEFRQ